MITVHKRGSCQEIGRRGEARTGFTPTLINREQMRRMRPIVPAVAIIAMMAAIGSAQVCARAQDSKIQLTPTTRPGSTPASRTLTIDQAVDLGVTNSKNLRLAAEAVNKARGRTNENRTGFLPTVGSDVTLTHLDEGSSFTLTDQNGNPVTVPIVKQDQKTVGINASVPIDIVGQIRAAVQVAEFQEIAARLDYNRTRNQTVLDIKNAYYDVLRAKAFVIVSEQSLTNSTDRLRIAEANLRAGTGTRFDVLRAQTDVANAQQSLIAAKNQVNLKTATLNNVLSLDQNTPLQVVEATEPAIPAKDFNSAVDEAYKVRPEVLQSDAFIRAAEKGVYIALRSQLPTFGLAWNFSYAPDQGGFTPRETSWAATAKLSIPIFEGGLAKARTQQARSDVNTQKVNKQVTLDTVALDVRQAYLAMTEAQDRLAVTDTALIQAQEQYRLAKIRFETGVTQTPGASPLLEISDAQTALTQAQNNQVNAKYDLQNAKARLDRAIGRYAYSANAKPGLPAPKPAR